MKREYRRASRSSPSAGSTAACALCTTSVRSPTVRAAAGRDGHPAPYSGVPVSTAGGVLLPVSGLALPAVCPGAGRLLHPPPERPQDLETVKRVGLEHYRETLGKKMEGLRFLLERCNDGRRKSLFCTAVNLLELEDVEAVIARLEEFGPGVSPEEQKDRGAGRLSCSGSGRPGVS
ncbi:MAG: hypothetical protein ACLRWQ_16525 [Flavonifractor plautii]